MYKLRSTALEVNVLDPQADRQWLGTRYCTGGYIFEVTDHELGPLTSGATYPDSFNVNDGQGMPDSFDVAPLRPAAKSDGPILRVGVGVCDAEARQVLEFSPWEVELAAARVHMRTVNTLGEYTFELERTVTVHERTVRSEVRLANRGQAHMMLRWYPHPFFPHPKADELCRLNFDVEIGESSGYEMSENGFIRRRGWPWTQGHGAFLQHHAQQPLTVLMRHPVVGKVVANFSYVPGFFVIWGNPRTFSFEPFVERTIVPGHRLAWQIEYHF